MPVPGYSWLSLLTDYGLEDGFVAACHGVVAELVPGARVIDITQLVPPGDIRRGATVLAQTVPSLPPAVHVGVVDPSVGTPRRPIAVAAGRSVLVGTDNGLLPQAAEALGGIGAVHELTNPGLWRHPVSATFHGRDIFCPAAAHLVAGVALDVVGARLDPDSLVRLPAPVAQVDGVRVEAEVVAVDRFGNAQFGCAPPPGWRLGQRLTIESESLSGEVAFERTFGAVAPGESVAFIDSAGLLALGVNGGRASDRLGLAPGVLLNLSPANHPTAAPVARYPWDVGETGWIEPTTDGL